MPIINESIWSKLPFKDYRPRFFIETWRELLSRNSPHFYQARLMNSFSALKEAQEVISDCLDNRKNITQLRSSIEELKTILNMDTILNDILGNTHALLLSYLQNISKNIENTQDITLNKLQQLINTAIKAENKHTEESLKALHKLITDPTAANHKERTLNTIYDLTSTLISTLLYQGYSSTYLFNRMDLLTRSNRYGNRDLSQQLTIVFERLLKPHHEYKAIIAFSSPKKSILFDSSPICDLKITNTPCDELKDIDDSKWGISEIDGFFTFTTSSTDYISAAWALKCKIEELKDLCSYEYKRNIIETSSICFVLINENQTLYKHRVKIELLQSLLIKRSDPYSINMISAVNEITSKDRSNNIKESISRILRYYRLGVSESTFESRFLSMWIALEALLDNEHGNNIDRILNTVPLLYAHDSLLKRLQYLHILLKREDVKIPDDIINKADLVIDDFNELTSLKLIYEILINEELAESLFNSLKDKEFLKFKIRKMHLEFKSKSSIKERIKKTKNDVTQQIRRIYYYRNKIVHKAFHGEISPRMYSHLCEYIGCILSEIIINLTSETDINNITEILHGYTLAMESKDKEWNEKDTLTFDDVIYLDPII